MFQHFPYHYKRKSMHKQDVGIHEGVQFGAELKKNLGSVLLFSHQWDFILSDCLYCFILGFYTIKTVLRALSPFHHPIDFTCILLLAQLEILIQLKHKGTFGPQQRSMPRPKYEKNYYFLKFRAMSGVQRAVSDSVQGFLKVVSFIALKYYN